MKPLEVQYKFTKILLEQENCYTYKNLELMVKFFKFNSPILISSAIESIKLYNRLINLNKKD